MLSDCSTTKRKRNMDEQMTAAQCIKRMREAGLYDTEIAQAAGIAMTAVYRIRTRKARARRKTRDALFNAMVRVLRERKGRAQAEAELLADAKEGGR